MEMFSHARSSNFSTSCFWTWMGLSFPLIFAESLSLTHSRSCFGNCGEILGIWFPFIFVVDLIFGLSLFSVETTWKLPKILFFPNFSPSF